MADYYPLLAKAVSGLVDSNATTRRAIYERARKALLGQLRAIQPPIAEADLARENGALDEAIARLEADIAAKSALEQSENALPEHPLPKDPSTQNSFAQNPPAENPSQTVVVPPRETSAPDAAAPSGSSAKMKLPPRSTPPLDAAVTEGRVDDVDEPLDGGDHQGSDKDRTIDLRLPKQRESNRPAAPLPGSVQANRKPVWIAGGIVLALVLGVAVVAIKLRDQPGDLSQLKPTAGNDQVQNGKNTDRIGVMKNENAPAANSGSSGAAGSAPVSKPAMQQGPVPVAYRAALLVEAPEEKEKTKTFIGSVVWRLDNVPSGAGQPLGTAIHADIDIPDAKLRMTLDIQKNKDPGLSASHVAEVRFSLLNGSIIPGVKLIRPLMMRRDDQGTGEALAGDAVPITDNFYLIALTQGDMEIRNSDLMKSRNWIDLPIGLSNGRVAKLTVEKGVSGERIFNDAFTVWGQK